MIAHDDLCIDTAGHNLAVTLGCQLKNDDTTDAFFKKKENL